MTINDYAVIGTADGLFAHGTGLLSEAHAAEGLFQYRLPRDTTQIIPLPGEVAIIRQPVVASATRERFHLFVQLAAAYDRARRPGFVGIAILIPWDDLSIQIVDAVIQRLDDLFQQAKERFIDKNGTFTKQPGPLKSSQPGSAPRLKTSDDGTRSIFNVMEDELQGSLMAQGLFVLSALESKARTVIQITTDRSLGKAPLTTEVISKYETELAEEERIHERKLEEQRWQDQITSLADKISALEFSVRYLEGDVQALRAQTNQSNPYLRSGGYVPPLKEDSISIPAGSHEDFEVGDPELIRDRRSLFGAIQDLNIARLLLVGIALVGSLVVGIMTAMFLLGGGAEVTLDSPPDTTAREQADFEEISCEAARDIVESSKIPGSGISEKLQELRSCIREDFEGLSPRQVDCEEPMFEETASELLGGDVPEAGSLSLIEDILGRCEGAFR